MSVIDFYNGKSVFITGGTGFIGKVLIEKLLYASKDIDKIYLLIRGQKGTNKEQRIQELIKKPVFDRIRSTRPENLKKLVAVPGDITQSNLGIRTGNEHAFLDKISVVFHSAATVQFNERLDIAADLNYEATKRVLKLCQHMKNLKSLVYISTAYTNPEEKVFEEIVYPAPATDHELQNFIKNKHMLDEAKLKQFLKGRPNTYTFTKALAESYVAMNHGDIPTAIVRPSIVTASYSDPTPGWIDAWSAATAILTSTTMGYKRVLIGDRHNRVDIIPVDYVANAAVIAGANTNNRYKDVEIFNVCTSAMNPLTLSDIYWNSRTFMVRHKINVLPFPFVVMVQSDSMHKVLAFILEKMPAYLLDSWLKLRGKKPRFMRVHSHVVEQREMVRYFTTRQWCIKADKTAALHRSLQPSDAKQFPCDPSQISWKKYIPHYCMGIKKYLLRK